MRSGAREPWRRWSLCSPYFIRAQLLGQPKNFSQTNRYAISSCHISTFAVYDAFLGLYNPHSSTADALTSAILDVMLRLNIPLEKLKGYSFDRNSNLSGRLNGVQAKLKEKQPKSM